MKGLVYFAIVLVANMEFAQAQNESVCAINDYQSLLSCAVKKSSDIKLSEQRIKSTGSLQEAAAQWENPELDLQSVSKGSEVSEKSATLFLNIPIGGKRAARQDEARAEHKKSVIQNQFDIQSTRLSLSLSFYRLAHLQKEIKIEQESVDTFSKIVKQFQDRKALSPEQDVSLSVFKMALADHQFNLVKLKSESEKIFQDLQASVELEKTVILKYLPKTKTHWTKLDGKSEIHSSPQIQAAQAEVELSQSQNEKAKADAWPDLKIGPTFIENKSGNETEKLAGLSLSMPLPVFSVNGGQKEYTKQRMVESQMSLELTKKKLTAVRTQLSEKYNNTVSVLKSAIDSKAVSEKHERIEHQFFKGVVPSSLIIEAHRQLYDLESRRNEAELEALEALGQVLIIDNKFNEVVL